MADPSWDDPLDGNHSRRLGGRWNAPGSFPVVYLSRSLPVARANVYRRLADQPYGPEDLDPARAPILVTTQIPEDRYVDAVTDRGCRAAGLPATYPVDLHGKPVGHATCQAIGEVAWSAGEAGIACRSAAARSSPGGEELAWFQRRARLRPLSITAFDEWFW